MKIKDKLSQKFTTDCNDDTGQVHMEVRNPLPAQNQVSSGNSQSETHTSDPPKGDQPRGRTNTVGMEKKITAEKPDTCIRADVAGKDHDHLSAQMDNKPNQLIWS